MIFKKNFKKNSGFTLLEILVVIAIIAILSAVIVSAFGSARSKTRDSRRISDIKQLKGAIDNYFATNFTYPASLSELQPAFLVTLPKDPQTNASYTYFTDAPVTGKRYHLCATTEGNFSTGNGKEGLVVFSGGDLCVGTNTKTFDVAGGIY